MNKHQSDKSPTEQALPPPVVLSLEDLDTVAAAGAVMASVNMPSMVLAKVIVAGGIPAAAMSIM